MDRILGAKISRHKTEVPHSFVKQCYLVLYSPGSKTVETKRYDWYGRCIVDTETVRREVPPYNEKAFSQYVNDQARRSYNNPAPVSLTLISRVKNDIEKT